MAITEEDRYRLYQRLEGVLNPEEARILMEHLPPVGWADVATKQDLEMLRLEVRADLGGLESRMLWGLVGILGANAALVVAAFGAGRLL